MISAGFFPRRIPPPPEVLDLPGVAEVCSATECVNDEPADWLDAWRHNEYGWFNTQADAWSVVPINDRSRYRMFAHRLWPTYYRAGEPQEVRVPEDVHPEPIPPSFVSLGYDAICNEACMGIHPPFAHSPL